MSDPPRRLQRAGWVALICVIALVVPALWSLTSQARPPAMTPAAPEPEPPSRRLVLIVVDGLRHDFATDPVRAPNFARNMREHSSAEVWAGRITMTSAAVLAFGTGTRGNFTQVVLNVEARRTEANHLFENARAAGMRVGLIGDPVWHQAYGDFDFQELSKPDLALDVDDSPELFAIAHRALDDGALPELSVLHFFAIDHLQHSHGVFSKKFGEQFLRFDQNLQRFLDALPKETTVLALSDHGALANGNHGVDSDLERKTPLFAYGPGIRKGQKLVLEQVDIAPTIAALLGIPSPAHGVGMPVTELVDAPPARLSALACKEAARIAALGQKLGAGAIPWAHASGEPSCNGSADPARDIAQARRAARHWDDAIAEASARSGVRGFLGAIAVVLLFAALSMIAIGFGSRSVVTKAVLAVGLTAAFSIGITAFVDHSLPPYNDARALLLWVTTGLLGLLLLLPALAERAYRRFPFAVLALAPGCFFASFPTNTQLHAGILVAVCALTAIVTARRAGMTLKEIAVPLVAAALGSAIALRLATVREDPLEALAGARGIGIGIVLVVIWLGVAALLSPRSGRRRLGFELGAGIPLAAFACLPHAWVPAALGLSAMLALPVAGLWAARAGYPLFARAALFAGYALVSRPSELAAVAGGALLAEALGALLSRARHDSPAAPLGVWQIVTLATSAFAVLYVVRVGVQGGLDFVTMDWRAGTFDSAQVSASRVTLAMFLKYASAFLLVGHALLSRLAPSVWRPALELLAAGLVLRLATMAAILFAPWVSFWSRYRMLGELGPVAVMCLLAAAGMIALGRSATRAGAADLVPSRGRT